MASQISPKRLIAAACMLAALAASLLIADLAIGGAAKVIGETNRTPKPLCPDDCRATGSVTGYGVKADGKTGLFKVPADGHIVAWSVDLSKPNEDQVEGFGKLFEDKSYGTDPIARIGILKRAERSRMKLTKQSPPVNLLPSLGKRPIFTLDKPLKAQKGTVVALTLPTWAPLFRDGLDANDNVWAASRKPDTCGAGDVTKAKPHQRKGEVRTYGCRLGGERILYWAFFTPSGSKGDGGGKNGQNNTLRIGPAS